MSEHNTITIPSSLLSEFAAWGRLTAKLLKQLEQLPRQQPQTVESGSTVKRPRSVPKDQAWFWTPEWQAMEREADEDVAHGRVTTFQTMDDALRALQQ